MESSDKAVVLGARDLIFPLPHHVTGADLEVTLPAWLFTLPSVAPTQCYGTVTVARVGLGNDGKSLNIIDAAPSLSAS